MIKLATTCILACFSLSLFGQSTGQAYTSVALPQISLLDIEPNNSTVVLALTAPTEAGLMNSSTIVSNTKWLNYTSALPTGSSRSISVEKSYGTIPSGTSLILTTSAATGGSGNLGSSAGTVQITSSPTIIVSNIRSSFTNNGTNFGHSLTYKLEVTNVSQLDFNSSATIGLTFTILDN